jgi:hypothetical protein
MEYLEAIIPLLVGGGLSLASLIGGALSGGGESEESAALRKMFLEEINTERGIARGGPSQARQDFDAVGQSREATEASFRLMAPDFFRGIENLTGGAEGAGRLSTGFFTEDLGDFTRRGLQQFADTATANSLRGLSLNLQNIEGGERTDLANRNLFFEAMLGGLDMETARKNAKDRRNAGLFGTIGQIGGAFLGQGGFNPFGSSIGGGSSGVGATRTGM